MPEESTATAETLGRLARKPLKSDKVRQSSPLDDSVSVQGVIIAELHDAITRLQDTLEPVLAPLDTEPADVGSKEPQVSSVLVGRVNENNGGINYAVQRINTLLVRIEV